MHLHSLKCSQIDNTLNKILGRLNYVNKKGFRWVYLNQLGSFFHTNIHLSLRYSVFCHVILVKDGTHIHAVRIFNLLKRHLFSQIAFKKGSIRKKWQLVVTDFCGNAKWKYSSTRHSKLLYSVFYVFWSRNLAPALEVGYSQFGPDRLNQ